MTIFHMERVENCWRLLTMKDKFIKDIERSLFALMQRNVHFLET